MQHRRGLDMDTLVFDPHQYHPERTLLRDRQCHREGLDQMENLLLDRFSVRSDICHFRPAVAALLHVVPDHLIYPYGKE